MRAPLRSSWIAVFIAAAAAAPALVAQASSLPHRLTILDAKKIEAVERGEAVAVTIDAPEKTEIVTLGIVRLAVPRAFYLERVRPLTGFLSNGSTPLSGTFSEPARLEDAWRCARARRRRLQDAREVQAFSCDVKPRRTSWRIFAQRSRNRRTPPRVLTRSSASRWSSAQFTRLHPIPRKAGSRASSFTRHTTSSHRSTSSRSPTPQRKPAGAGCTS